MVREVVDRARAFEPSARYASAAEFSEAFAQAMGDAGSPIKRVLARLDPRRGVSLVNAFREAPATRKALALFLWGILVFAVIQIMPRAFAEASSGRGFVGGMAFVLGILIVCAFFLGLGYHIACALVGARGYATEKHRVLRFLINFALMYGATYVLAALLEPLL